MIERNIDYLQYSLNYREQTCVSQGHRKLSGHGFYTRGYMDGLGVARYFGNPNSKKAFVVMSGRALHNHRAVNWDIVETMQKVIDSGGKFSRIDIAITEYVEDKLFTLDDVENSINDERIVSSWFEHGSKKIVAIDREYDNPTETIYMGDMENRGKKGIFRAYDKGLEMGLDRWIATRIEVEDRGDRLIVWNGNAQG